MILPRFDPTKYRVFSGSDQSYASRVNERVPAFRDATRARGRNANLSVGADGNRNIQSAFAIFAIPSRRNWPEHGIEAGLGGRDVSHYIRMNLNLLPERT